LQFTRIDASYQFGFFRARTKSSPPFIFDLEGCRRRCADHRQNKGLKISKVHKTENWRFAYFGVKEYRWLVYSEPKSRLWGGAAFF
jgi:hypothetical protein